MADQSETDKNAEAFSDTIRGAFSNVKESAKQSASTLGDRAGDEAEGLEEEAETGWQEGEASLQEMLTKAEFAIIDHPLAAVGVAFAAGWMMGKLFR